MERIVQLMKGKDAIKHWKFNLVTPFNAIQNQTQLDLLRKIPPTKSSDGDGRYYKSSLEKVDNGIGYYAVTLHYDNEMGSRTLQHTKTAFRFTLTRDPIPAPTIISQHLRQIARYGYVIVNDISLRAVNDVALKDVKEAIYKIRDLAFSPTSKMAEARLCYPDVCIYEVNSNGVGQIWLQANFAD